MLGEVIFYLIGTAGMIYILSICQKKLGYDLKKCLLGGALIALSSGICSVILFEIENIHNSPCFGVSFYGSVLFNPLLLMLAARIMKTKTSFFLDASAPAVCLMNTVMKINCMIAGCCEGVVLSIAKNGKVTRFPSQIVEGAVSLAITVMLIVMNEKKKLNGIVFPIFMITYGFCRFWLNFLRETTPVMFGLAFGNIWSIVSVAAGTVWLLIALKKREKS